MEHSEKIPPGSRSALSRWSRGPWRDGVMDRHMNLVERLCSQLAVEGVGTAGKVAMARFAAAGVALEGAVSPVELARACHSGSDRQRSRAVVAGLLALAPGDPVAALCALAALGPGLTRLVRLAEAWGIERDEAESSVLAAAWDAVHCGASTAAGVIGWARSDVRNEARRDRRRSTHECLGADVPQLVIFERDEQVGVLDDAVGAGALSERQASVLWAVRGHGVEVADVAEVFGCSPLAVRRSLKRSEEALRVFLGKEER